MLELPADITLAILPGGEHSRSLAQAGYAAGHEILLHQPMEPMDYPRIKPGPGAIFVAMGEADIQRILRKNLTLFPEAAGINNHMGSRFTSDPRAMDVVMAVLHEKQMFFIDSRTSESSIGKERAIIHKIPTAARDVFIDNNPEVGAILRRLKELERDASRRGDAIGIGHPYRATLTALQLWLPTLKERGFRLVRVSQFLRPPLPQKKDPQPLGDSNHPNQKHSADSALRSTDIGE